MNITELVAQYREETKDDTVPYFLSDAEVAKLFTEAEVEACARKDLIFDNSTASICEIAVAGTAAKYNISSLVVKVTAAYLTDSSGTRIYLKNRARDWMDSNIPLWREDEGQPHTIIVDEQSVQIVPAPAEEYTLHLEVYRRPLAAMTIPVSPALPVSPEIAPIHHGHLYKWVLHRAYAKRDSDMYDLQLSNFYEGKFSRYFGIRNTADQGRSARVPQRNKLW